jgi:hypothetical protein
MSCPDCARDADHCHGTLVLNIEGSPECTDGNCVDVGRDRHDLVVVVVVGGGGGE